MTSTSTSHQQQQQSSSGDFQPAHTSHMDHGGQLGTSGYAPSDNQLAGLVEAATAAADQDVSEWAAVAAAAAAAGHHHLDGYGADLHLGDDSFDDGGFGNIGVAPGSGRQLRGSTTNGQTQGGQTGLSRGVSKKRKRGDDALDPALAGFEGNGQGQQHFDGDSLDIRELPPQQSLSDARAAGVHSAAALFRQPSSNKKYTRPPMSRLFSSLELSPENFLHLQAAAKNYMLDDNHPERRDCVGQRGKGDTEMVKLRLWNCVRNFLEAEGYGERFFGEHVVNESMPPRQFIWPRDQHKIISLVIPLLRRMVTNERQRQYAIETRKGGGPDERKRRKTEDSFQNFNTSHGSSDLQDQHQSQAMQLQDHHQTHQQYLPPPPSHPPELTAPAPDVGVGLTNLVLEGYPTDWDAVSKSYSMYNQDYQLDNLWSISGLQQPDWRGLFAAMDSHYHVVHEGNPLDCGEECANYNMKRILSSEEIALLGWRVGGNEHTAARHEFASSITRDLDRIIKMSTGQRDGSDASQHLEATRTNANGMPGHCNQAPFEPAPTPTSGSGPHPDDTSPITLHLNVMQSGKRVAPKLNVTAEQCPDLASVRQLISRSYPCHLPFDGHGDVDASHWKIQVWLPEGLVPVQNDGEWTIAQLSAGTVDWMDGDLRVVIDVGDSAASTGAN